MSWTEERIQKLKSMWGHGYSASQIATELGGTITRNAVIGKAHRLNLATTKIVKPRTIKAQARPRLEGGRVAMPRMKMLRPVGSLPQAPKKIGRSAIVSVDPQYRDPEFRPETADVPLDLKESQCRWPLGDPCNKNFRYCGGHAHEGVPYCTEHAKIAYNNFGRGRGQRQEQAEHAAPIVAPVLISAV